MVKDRNSKCSSGQVLKVEREINRKDRMRNVLKDPIIG
jgi:hypothetical protein